MPHFDPASETLTWDGKSWNINNNRIFEMRFEKYLNAPEETTKDDTAYQNCLKEILQRLAPGNATAQNLDYAFQLLGRAANYEVDARLSDSLADAVYTVWMAQRQQQRLVSANDALQRQQKEMEDEIRAEGNHASSISNPIHSTPKKGGNPQQPQQNTAQDTAADSKQAGLETNNWRTRRLTELTVREKANVVKRELSEIQAKVEYQALIVQFFVQRRFQHVLMATRFYRALFSDGDSKLNLGKDSKDLFTRSAGMAPTVSTLDSLANEAVRDVREGVNAFDYLLQQDEMESASKRLAEAFTVGEFMPEIRTLPREKKRRALAFTQKAYQLISSLEVKDYTLAGKLVGEIQKIAKDFDASKPNAAIRAASLGSKLHLQNARNAALKGDDQAVEREISAAAAIWPTNPALEELGGKISDQGDLQMRALNDLDQLISQKNYRQIFEDSPRFLAASAQSPERKKQLAEVIDAMKSIDGAILRAQEMSRQNNFAGAWESVEGAAAKYPDDVKLNQTRAELTTKAADFVRTIQSAEDLEKKDQIGSSLAWYLKAQKMYAGSDYAQKGIDRLTKKVLPQE